MKKYFFVILLLLLPQFMLAYYSSVSMYPPDWTPQNYNLALENDDYDGCVMVLDDFHDAFKEFETEYYKVNRSSWPSPQNFTLPNYNEVSIGDKKTSNGQGMIQFTEDAIRLCLIDAVEWREGQAELALEEEEKDRDIKARAAARDCDFDTIETLGAIERNRYSDEIDDCYAIVAIEKCDMESIDDFNNRLRMAYYDEIKDCKAELSGSAQMIEPISIPAKFTPQSVTYTPPAQTFQVQELSSSSNHSNSLKEIVETDTSESTTTDATSTPENVITITEEELDRIVQQKLEETLSEQNESEPESQPRLNIFKRVWNFITSLF